MEKKLAINTGHTAEVRRTLDEAVQQILAEQKYPEDVYWGNVKLVIMAFACSIAAFAHFNHLLLGWEFPDNRIIVGVCCVLYFGASGVLQFMFTFIDKDFILFCNYKNVKNPPKWHKENKLGVRSDLGRFDHMYKLAFEVVGKPELTRVEFTTDGKQGMSIGRFFDYEGFFHPQEFKKQVVRLLREYEKKLQATYDSSKSQE